MPRLARLDAPGVLHHVMGRGIEKNKIFLKDKDRNDFLNRLSGLVEEGAVDIYAWALMSNHFHLLLKTKNRPLSSSMRKLLTGYVVNFNRRHKRYGHLFQNRYKSIVCQEDAYLMELVRYIHLNLFYHILETRECAGRTIINMLKKVLIWVIARNWWVED